MHKFDTNIFLKPEKLGRKERESIRNNNKQNLCVSVKEEEDFSEDVFFNGKKWTNSLPSKRTEISVADTEVHSIKKHKKSKKKSSLLPQDLKEIEKYFSKSKSPCEACGCTCSSFKRAKSFVETLKARYPCTLCEYITYFEDFLKRHILKSHSDNKYLFCKYCNYKTCQRGRYLKHCLTHSEDDGVKLENTDDLKCKADSSDQELWSDDGAFDKLEELVEDSVVENCIAVDKIDNNQSPNVEPCGTSNLASTVELNYVVANTVDSIQERELKTTKDFVKVEKILKKRGRKKIYNGNDTKKVKLRTESKVKRQIFICDLCNHSSFQRGYFLKHMKTHYDEKRFHCKVCGYKTHCKGTMTRHKITHTGEKPYLCDQCGFNCNSIPGLRRHLLAHTGLKPFKCDKCSFRSMNRSILKTHMDVHTPNRKFACNLCDYRAKRLIHLKVHRFKHSNEKPYKCDECDQTFKLQQYLRYHKKTHIKHKILQFDKDC